MPKNGNRFSANSESKNIHHFNKSFGREKMPFSLGNKTDVRAKGSQSPPGLEQYRHLSK